MRKFYLKPNTKFCIAYTNAAQNETCKRQCKGCKIFHIDKKDRTEKLIEKIFKIK